MKKIAKFAAIFASTGFIASSASAGEPLQVASIGDMSGRVMVYDGNKYTAAKSGMPLEVGDRVVTLKGAKADVTFQQGCVASLDENAVFAIAGVDVCESGLVQTEEPLRYAQAIGASDASGGGVAAGFTTSGKIFAVVSAVGVTAAVIEHNRGSSRRSASPQ